MPKKSVREMTSRERAHYSFAARTFHAVLIFAAVLSTAAVGFGLYLYANAITREYRTETWRLSRMAASLLEDTGIHEKAGDLLDIYLSIPEEEKGDGRGEAYLARYGDYRDEVFETACLALQDLQEESGAVAAYIAAIRPDSQRLVFLVDSDPKDSFCPPGSWDTMKMSEINAFLYGMKKNLFDKIMGDTERIPATSVNMEPYGYRCTAATPLFEKDGYSVMIFIDMDMNHVAAASRRFFFQYLILILLVTLLAAFVFVQYLKRTAVAPINQLAEAAEAYTRDRMDEERDKRHFGRLDIRTGDEIENLSLVLKDMEEDMGVYLRSLTKVTAEKERIGMELSLATRIQADMLPNIFPAFPERPEFDIYASMMPAKEVGGDFYDFFLVDDDHLGLVMADVSGKGVPAALFMMVSKILVQNYAMTGRSPAEVLKMVNDQICSNNREEMFVTVWLGILDLETGQLVAANAGHEYPVLQNSDGVFEVVKDRHGLVIGGMAGMMYRDYELKLEPGYRLFLYTDGVPEATNAENELFGLERTVEALNRKAGEAPREILAEVDRSVAEFVGEAPQFDDLTMLCLLFLGEEGRLRKDAGVLSHKEMTVPATVDTIGRLTDLVNDELDRFSCSKRVRTQIDVAMDEILGNIARYAYASGGGIVTLLFDIRRDPLRAELTFVDRGKPFNPLEADDPDTSLSAEEREIGGLGIFLVRKTMDDVRYFYQDGLNILQLVKNLEG